MPDGSCAAVGAQASVVARASVTGTRSTLSLAGRRLSSISRKLSLLGLSMDRVSSKPFNSHFRWNLLLVVVVFASIIAPVGLTLGAACGEAFWYMATYISALNVLWTGIAVSGLTHVLWLAKMSKVKWAEELPSEAKAIKHMVMIVTYKEPMEVICQTINTLTAQTVAKSIVLVVGMEEKTPDLEARQRQLCERYHPHFLAVICTKHPKREGEVAGKCSNENWAMRSAVEVLQRQGLLDNVDNWTGTSCDADTMFHPEHYASLASDFARNPQKHRCIWQPFLFYNWDLHERYFFTRVTAMIRSTMMAGFLVPAGLQNMSVYHFSMKLCAEAGYWHPRYQMEDIMFLFSAMQGTGGNVRLRPMPVPLVIGPTSGDTLREEFKQWEMQARRWTNGNAESFHYFVVKACLRRKLPMWVAIKQSLLFLIYYGCILCGTSLSMALMGILVYMPTCSDVFGSVEAAPAWPRRSFLQALLAYHLYAPVVFVFAQDAYMRHFVLSNAQAERFGALRQLAHFILTPLVLLGYSCVALYALLDMMVKGKKACVHQSMAAGKDALNGDTVAANTRMRVSTCLSDVLYDSDGQEEVVNVDQIKLEAGQACRVEVPATRLEAPREQAVPCCSSALCCAAPGQWLLC